MSNVNYVKKFFLIAETLCSVNSIVRTEPYHLTHLCPFLFSDNCMTLVFFGTWFVAAAAAKSLQSCLTLCDPIDGSLPGSPIPGILQARTLEWAAISFSSDL